MVVCTADGPLPWGLAGLGAAVGLVPVPCPCRARWCCADIQPEPAGSDPVPPGSLGAAQPAAAAPSARGAQAADFPSFLLRPVTCVSVPK